MATFITGRMVQDSSLTLQDISQNSGPFTFRNKIINGGFEIWQRGASFTSVGGSTYTADRWITWIGTGSITSITRGNFGTGPAASIFPETNSYISVVVGTGGDLGIAQNIENVRTLATKTVTYSFWIKATSNTTLDGVYLIQYANGSNDWANASVTGGSLNAPLPGNTWTKVVGTVTLPSLAGKTIGPVNFLQMRIDFNHTYVGEMQITQVQLEEGPVATPYEIRPFGIELLLCQRYFCKSYQVDLPPGYAQHDRGVSFICPEVANDFNTVNRSFNGCVRFPVEMRTVPTVTLYDPNGGVAGRVGHPNRGETNVWRSNMVPNAADAQGFQEIFASPTFTASNWGANWQGVQFQYTADAEIR